MRHAHVILYFFIWIFANACNPSIDIYQDVFKLDMLPISKSDWQGIMFSSYDRSGGNDDGFNGTYSKIREENGNSVLAEAFGGGYISRIWLPPSRIDHPGLLNNEREHIKIYIDDREVPIIDFPLEDMFTGKQEGFPIGLVGHGLGGYYSYVPMPFANYCRVEVEGTGVRFYQINIQKYSGPRAVQSYLAKDAKKIYAFLEDVGAWLKSGPENKRKVARETSLEVTPGGRDYFEITGKGVSIVGFLVSTSPEQFEALLKSRIRFFWDDKEDASIDMPTNMFFSITDTQSLHNSLFAGFKDGKLYNTMPMPFGGKARIEIESEEGLQLSLQYFLEKSNNNAYRLTGFYNEELPAKDPECNYLLLDVEGEGHYMGTFLMTEGSTYGDQHLPIWLEGDDVFVCDGEMLIHGTGTEDYFNCGWYSVPGRLSEPGSFPLHGFPQFHMDKIGKASAYRWHLSDPVPFKQSIHVSLEHGTNNTVEADYRSVVFYYLKVKAL